MRLKLQCLALGTVLGAMFLVGCKGNNDPEPGDEVVYFKVGEMSPEHNESFILPLTDPAHIAHARALIANPEMDGKLVLATVVAASGTETYKNKDLNSGEVWSWKVSEVEGFADMTIEILDGGPSDVEDMDFWFPNTNNGSTTAGKIGFWNYTVKAEVSADLLK